MWNISHVQGPLRILTVIAVLSNEARAEGQTEGTKGETQCRCSQVMNEPALSLLACCPVGGSVEVGRLLSSGAQGHLGLQARYPALGRTATGRAIDLGRNPILGQEPRAPPGLPGPAEGRCSPQDILC